jgi:hypothetical protein
MIGELLTGHPEAVTLQAEASHSRALARCSAAHASQAFDAAQQPVSATRNYGTGLIPVVFAPMASAPDCSF